jgi:phosphoheptose isomerase
MFDHHLQRHLAAVSSLSAIRENIEAAGNCIAVCLQGGGKVLLCGNGGSAADAQHIAAELVGRFVTERRGLPAIALTTDTSILTAVGNDYGFNQVFARQIEALAREGDVLIAISTSGNSANILAAVDAAAATGCRTIGLTGREGGKLRDRVDVAVVVAVPETAHIQECHLLIGHLWCAMVDHELGAGQT